MAGGTQGNEKSKVILRKNSEYYYQTVAYPTALSTYKLIPSLRRDWDRMQMITAIFDPTTRI
jgi:hypothetical protein